MEGVSYGRGTPVNPRHKGDFDTFRKHFDQVGSKGGGGVLCFLRCSFSISGCFLSISYLFLPKPRLNSAHTGELDTLRKLFDQVGCVSYGRGTPVLFLRAVSYDQGTPVHPSIPPQTPPQGRPALRPGYFLNPISNTPCTLIPPSLLFQIHPSP